MPKVTVAFGSQVCLESDLDYAEIQELEKYLPDSLILKDEENNPYFRVMTGNAASCDDMGIVFASKSRDGKAVYTTTIEADSEEEFKNEMTDRLLVPFERLHLVEAQALQAIGKLHDARENFMANVTYLG